MENKSIYTVTHEHRFGETFYLVRSNHVPSETEVVKAHNIDFEPDKEEVIIIGDPIEIGDIKEIPDRPENPGEEWRGDSDGTVGVD